MTEALTFLLETLGEVRARSVVRDIGTPKSMRDLDRLAAFAVVRAMLADGQDRRSIAYRLAAKYDVSLKSAYRRIAEAIARPS